MTRISKMRYSKRTNANQGNPNQNSTFTQLAADNQHAALGLMLITVLAKASTLLSGLLPRDEDADTTAGLRPEASTSSSSGHADREEAAQEEHRDRALEKGIAVPRQTPGLAPRRDGDTTRELNAAEPSGQERDVPKPGRGSRESAKGNKQRKKQRKARNEKDEFSNLFASL